jgi:hypothetical protein
MTSTAHSSQSQTPMTYICFHPMAVEVCAITLSSQSQAALLRHAPSLSHGPAEGHADTHAQRYTGVAPLGANAICQCADSEQLASVHLTRLMQRRTWIHGCGSFYLVQSAVYYAAAAHVASRGVTRTTSQPWHARCIHTVLSSPS